MSMTKDFSDRVVLITGSSSGIGACTAQEFARAGAQVVINGRNPEIISKVAAECQQLSPHGLEPLEIVADVSIEEDCQRLIDTVIEKFGKLDILVNNAGRGAFNSPVIDPNILTTFDDLMNLNLRSIVNLTQLSVPHLEKTKGNIINISSTLSLRPMAGVSVYCASKSALDMFTKCAALELGPKGIRVNLVNPSAVRTNFGPAMGMDQTSYEAMLDHIVKQYPLGRVGEPIDIANAIMFLASDDCSWVTGINFVSDGGENK